MTSIDAAIQDSAKKQTKKLARKQKKVSKSYTGTRFADRTPGCKVLFRDRLAPSSSDFPSRLGDADVVDKSLAIRAFLECRDFACHQILRPRRTGKTLLLGMFK